MASRLCFLLLLAAPFISATDDSNMAIIRGFEKMLNAQKPAFENLLEFKANLFSNLEELQKSLDNFNNGMSLAIDKSDVNKILADFDIDDMLQTINDGLHELWEDSKNVSDFTNEFSKIVFRMVQSQPDLFKVVDNIFKIVNRLFNNQKAVITIINKLDGTTGNMDSFLIDIDNKVQILLRGSENQMKVLLRIRDVLAANEQIREFVRELVQESNDIIDSLKVVKSTQNDLTSQIDRVFFTQSDWQSAYQNQNDLRSTFQVNFFSVINQGKLDVFVEVERLEGERNDIRGDLRDLSQQTKKIKARVSDLDVSVDNLKVVIENLVKRLTPNLDESVLLIIRNNFESMVIELKDLHDDQEVVIRILQSVQQDLERDIAAILRDQARLEEAISNIDLSANISTELNRVVNETFVIGQRFNEIERFIIEKILVIKKKQDNFVFVIQDRSKSVLDEVNAIAQSQEDIKELISSVMAEFQFGFDMVQGNASLAMDAASACQVTLVDKVNSLLSGHVQIKEHASRTNQLSLDVVATVSARATALGSEVSDAFDVVAEDLDSYMSMKAETEGFANSTCKAIRTQVDLVMDGQVSVRGSIRDVETRVGNSVAECVQTQNRTMSAIFASQDAATEMRASLKGFRCSIRKGMKRAKGNVQKLVAEVQQGANDVNDQVEQHATAYSALEGAVASVGSRADGLSGLLAMQNQAEQVVNNLWIKIQTMEEKFIPLQERFTSLESCLGQRCPSP